MKLPDFRLNAHLNALRDAMGAPLVDTFRPEHSFVPIALPDDALLGTDGIDVSFDEIQSLVDGTLEYKGRRVLLYIRDIANYSGDTTLPKFHVAYCRTLEQMRAANRLARYVVATRDDGRFLVNALGVGGGGQAPTLVALDVCQNCLAALTWKGFTPSASRDVRLHQVQTFDLREFFRKFPKDLLSIKPKYDTDSAPLNEYPANWPLISEQYKTLKAFTCERCHIVLAGVGSRFLHVHHKNGQKHDCQFSNLEALCIRCHSEQPLHGHLRQSPEFFEFQSFVSKW